ncbi:MAG: carbohydrate porin [Calditrichae bacterium]|nr:carbohydrate porin [Calditrichia bacterium]
MPLLIQSDENAGWTSATNGWIGLRSKLAEKGIELETAITGDMISNVSGGISSGNAFLNNVDVAISFDGETLMGWQGATLLTYILGNYGGSPGDYVGDFQGVSNIDAFNTWKVYELWLEQNFAQDSWSFKAGLIDLNSEFYVTETAGFFINSSFGIGAEFAQTGQNGPSIFPATSLALRVRYSPMESVYGQFAAFDAVSGNPDNPRGTQIHRFNSTDGLLLTGEIGSINSGEAFGESYQKIAIGGWRYTADFASIDETSSSNNNMGVYLLGERQLFREYSDPAQGLSCFANVGFANSTYNQIGLFYSAGAVYSGVFPGRDADAVGIAVATVRSGTPFRQWMIQTGQPVENAETAIELSYRAQLFPWFAFQPDLQYIVNPGMDSQLQNSIAVGARFEISL